MRLPFGELINPVSTDHVVCMAGNQSFIGHFYLEQPLATKGKPFRKGFLCKCKILCFFGLISLVRMERHGQDVEFISKQSNGRK